MKLHIVTPTLLPHQPPPSRPHFCRPAWEMSAEGLEKLHPCAASGPAGTPGRQSPAVHLRGAGGAGTPTFRELVLQLRVPDGLGRLAHLAQQLLQAPHTADDAACRAGGACEAAPGRVCGAAGPRAPPAPTERRERRPGPGERRRAQASGRQQWDGKHRKVGPRAQSRLAPGPPRGRGSGCPSRGAMGSPVSGTAPLTIGPPPPPQAAAGRRSRPTLP